MDKPNSSDDKQRTKHRLVPAFEGKKRSVCFIRKSKLCACAKRVGKAARSPTGRDGPKAEQPNLEPSFRFGANVTAPRAVWNQVCRATMPEGLWSAGLREPCPGWRASCGVRRNGSSLSARLSKRC